MTHTPEPWDFVVADNAPEPFVAVDAADGWSRVAVMSANDPHDAEERETATTDACRIVACVNACAGMADPAGEIARLRAVEDAAREALEILPDYMAYAEQMRALGRGLMDPSTRHGRRPDSVLYALRTSLNPEG